MFVSVNYRSTDRFAVVEAFVKLLTYSAMTLALQMVLAVQDDRGRAAGKVRMIAKLSNAATEDYDYRHNMDSYPMDPLGMDGVSVPGAGAAQSMSYLNALNATGGSGKKRNSIASVTGGAGAGAGSVLGGGASVPGVSYGKDFDYLLQSQVEATNELASVALLSCTLLGIAVIDLRAVHTFAPNSPSVNIACGKVVATTPVRFLCRTSTACASSLFQRYNFAYSDTTDC
jgi:hypothetical protein